MSERKHTHEVFALDMGDFVELEFSDGERKTGKVIGKKDRVREPGTTTDDPTYFRDEVRVELDDERDNLFIRREESNGEYTHYPTTYGYVVEIRRIKPKGVHEP